MSPEQILGGPLDGRSDVYSLACVLYEMLSASPPFAGPGARAVLVAHASHSAPSVRERRREVPVALEEALFVALAKAPGERYASASGFRDALDVGTPSAASPHGRRAPSRVRRRWLAAAALGVLGIGGAAAWLSAARRTSVALAVLPFVNQSSSADDQYFADGMTDELINALGRIPGFQVASRTSVYALREAHLDPAALSARLNANKLVEASVQRAAGELRVTARLINAKDGYVLWSQTYRRDLKNVFAVQDEIVRAIVGALAGRLAASSQTLLHHSTDNVDAYDEYLKGRYFWEQRFRGPDAMRRAVMHFERAIARDSSYAQAWAGLADVYSLQPGFGDVKPGDAFPKARAAALRALALDSTLAEAHTSLGIVSVFYDWNWAGAEREFDRALALDASESRSHLFHAWCLVGAGKYDAATEEIRTAQRLDPTSPIIGARLGTILMYTGHPDEGTRALRAALDLDSTNVAARGELILALALERKFTEALAIAPPPADLAAGFNGAAIMAFALGGAGRLSEARAQAQRLDEMSRTRYVTPEAFALTALALGDTARALDWLERGYREHSFFMLFTAIFPPYAPLRGSARYARIIEGMRLGTPIGGAGSAAKQPSTP
jgi:serine/threonine-protein kinase